MEAVASSKRVARFGAFEFDAQTGEVRKKGAKRTLTGQPLRVLTILLESTDEVVDREALRKRLWPEDTFVDFDHSLRVAINKVREALRDSADSPRFIETVRGRGYRFIGPVRWEDGPASLPSFGAPPQPEAHFQLKKRDYEVARDGVRRTKSLAATGNTLSPRPLRLLASETGVLVEQQPQEKRVQDAVEVRPPWSLLIALGVSLLIACISITGLLTGRSVPLRRFQQLRPTANPEGSPVYNPALSPNSKYLGYSDQLDIHVQLVQTGESHSVPLPPGVEAGRAFWEFDSWYPESTRFVAALAIPGEPASLWSVPILGGEPLDLIEDVNGDAAVSPDDSSIVFSRTPGELGAREIWLMGSGGESPRKILTATGQSRFGRIVWSPSGSRIAYEVIRGHDKRYDHSIKSCDLNGSNRTTIVPDEVTSGRGVSDFVWILPGRFVYKRGVEDNPFADENLWELQVNTRSGVPKGSPRRLTYWSGFSVNDLSATADGKSIAFQRSDTHWSVLVGNFPPHGSRLVKPRRLTMDEYLDMPFAWTADSRSVIFVSNRGGSWAVYKQRIDHGAPELVAASAALDADEPRLSPDGLWVLFPAWPHGALPGTPAGIYRAAVEGGPSQRLFEAKRFLALFCTNRTANFCAYSSHSKDQRAMIITAFRVTDGAQKELTRIPVQPDAEYHWASSPDGSQMAVLKNDPEANEINFIPLPWPFRERESDGVIASERSGKRKGARVSATRTVFVKGYFNLESLEWAPDSKSLFVAAKGPNGATLLRIGLNGKLQPIWQQPQANQIWGIPSPDGRHIAIHADSVEADVWMLSNF